MKLSRMCKANYTVKPLRRLARERSVSRNNGLYYGKYALTPAEDALMCGINTFTHMTTDFDAHSKRHALRDSGTFNPRSAEVRHSLFAHSEFFDPQDLVQLKYETLRALEKDGYSIAQAAGEFGLSRPTIYQAQAHFRKGGLPGLLPRQRGPRHPHKLTGEVFAHLQDLRAKEPELNAEELARRLRQRFKVKLHRRTIEKALKARAKRGPQTTP
jgi:transposase